MNCLLVSSGDGTLAALLREYGVNLAVRKSESDARRLLEQKKADCVIIDTPLSDSFGCEYAVSLADFYQSAVGLICDGELYREVREKIKGHAVFLISRPYTKETLFACLDFLSAYRIRTDELISKTEKLRRQAEDVKIIEKAKYKLMEYLNLSEPEAHKYIEKQAMDRRVTKRAVADEIIKTY